MGIGSQDLLRGSYLGPGAFFRAKAPGPKSISRSLGVYPGVFRAVSQALP